ncbi:hypothetical protein GCM10008955_09410 [Deinococcus malanensis]|uniref:Lipocalin-like domain-containing protein n=1 Tax=Deinococcus malanensis TaxID=1706855 RepID=A0ABQ2ENP9_9DEIO|nr:hypothetical protein [Deinococcus malanensis]GGK18122.1 hypothetical protein GCM10008955_09410 [Deinococcus malanensis]
MLATKISDITGIWKQYQGNPLFAPSGNMGFIRYNADGSFALGATPESTAAPRAPFPSGTVRFADGRMTMQVQNAPPTMPECARAVYEVRVIKMGQRPVALYYTPVEDTCKPRLADLGHVLPYIGPAR